MVVNVGSAFALSNVVLETFETTSWPNLVPTLLITDTVGGGNNLYDSQLISAITFSSGTNTEIFLDINNDIKERKKPDEKADQKDVLTFRSPFHVIGRVYNSSKLSAENSKQISNKKIN